jgi:glycine/D-amino acid oxidase-like deaminating enzyme
MGAVVVGGGQAGLSVSRELTYAGVEHVVLERAGWDRRGGGAGTASAWSLRTGACSFRAIRTTWTTRTASCPATSWWRYLERYAAGFGASVREGVEVSSVRVGPDGDFALETSAGEVVARTVVLSTGAYQRPHRPAGAAGLPPGLLQIDVEDYRNPGDLPGGPGAHDVFWWAPGGGGTSTTMSTRCRTRPPGSRPTPRRRDMTAVTTSTTALPACLRRARLSDPRGRREHGGSRPLLRRGALPAEA